MKAFKKAIALSDGFLAEIVDSRRRTLKIFLTNISEFRKWKCPWGIIEQLSDNEVIAKFAKYPQAE
ncbi:MAG: hypothetical protein IJB79_01580 [Candidatus Gastranaerophilales bacterium]|nr:hypothetical protein [Candidatus Gastranaerophilales bacterium]